MKKRNYMIGNAHLDPVWQWRWQEGYSEAKATFRSALDRMKEEPDFIFTCAGASVYSWVEESAPEMFEEIRQRVSEGRWKIVGGMWVQPDCNLPSGESFARQCLYSQRYFMEKFGVTAETGYNVDSFGHNGNLPQLLVKSGMDKYVMMRPMKHEKEMEQNLFYWEAPDKNRVLTFRIPIAYTCNFNDIEEMKAYFETSCDEQPKDLDCSMLFYGVGNHGGGPTKKNLELIKKLSTEDEKLIFASPEDYFKDAVKNSKYIPVHKDDLQHHASGCYSAVSEVKKYNRLGENRLIAAEKASFMAEKLAGGRSDSVKLREAWKNVLFNQFHDSLGGCSTFMVYPDIYEFAGEALSCASKIQNIALQKIGWKIDTTFAPVGSSPVLIYNPNAFPVKDVVRINFSADEVYGWNGQKVVFQKVFSHTSVCTGREDTIFEASVPAMGWNCYYLKYSEIKSENEKDEILKAEGNVLENELIKVTFSSITGMPESIFDKESGKEILADCARAVIYDDTKHDTWSHAMNFWDEKIGEFAGAEISVRESGPVRAVIKTVIRYGGSELVQYFALSHGSRSIETEVRLDWQEKHRLLKLEYPSAVKDPEAWYEIPYARIRRPCDGEEESALNYAAVTGDMTLALYNNDKYSYSIKNSKICLTAVRSPIYGDHGRYRDPELEFTDIGIQRFSYALEYIPGKADFAYITKKAAVFNSKPEYIFESVHGGSLPASYEGACAENGDILLSVIKDSEDGKGITVRAVNLSDENRSSVIKINTEGYKFKADFGPYEIKTLIIDDGGARECLLTEY